jgi:hypothetical protein
MKKKKNMESVVPGDDDGFKVDITTGKVIVAAITWLGFIGWILYTECYYYNSQKYRDERKRQRNVFKRLDKEKRARIQRTATMTAEHEELKQDVKDMRMQLAYVRAAVVANSRAIGATQLNEQLK